MKKLKLLVLLLAAVALLLGGCGGTMQARNMELKNALLVNPDILEKGKAGQALYRYQDPKVNISEYDKVLIDPVLISKEAELTAEELDNYKKLANNFYVYLNQELSKQFTVTTVPAPGTVRIQCAIIDADSSKPVRTILSYTPIGLGVNLIKYSATGKPSAVGDVSAELKVTDAMTGKLIGAAVDRRVGGVNPKNVTDTWANADNAIQYWAKKMTYVFCTGKGHQDCAKPEE